MNKKIQEINLSSKSQERKSKVVVHKNHMPIVRCTCGCEILVVPDLKAMNRAITRHLAEHKGAHGDAEDLEMFLTEQVLIVASRHVSFN
jgi:hypothetical protein